MSSLQKYRWLAVGQTVVYTRKTAEAKGLISHRKTGDRGIILRISGGANRNCLVQFVDGMDMVSWANLGPVREE